MSEIQHVRIKDITSAHAGQSVEIRGWLRNKPGGKGRYFLWLRDGSGEIQAVAEQDELPASVWADCERIGLESSIVVTGTVRQHPKNADEFELQLTDIRVLQDVADYPIGKKAHGVEFLMKNRHLWLRGTRQSAILRIRSEVQKAFADFFYDRGFYRVDTPVFTPNACEGTTTLFEVDYHGDTVYLTQSGQLYNEADIGALGQVYCFGPTFRAEKSKTRRHLLEFWMLEMEAAYYDHFDNMRCQEEMLAFTVRRILDNCRADLKLLDRDPAKLEPALETPYPRIRYGDTIEIINDWRIMKLAESRQVSPEQGREMLFSGKSVNIRDESFEDANEQKQRISAFRWGDDYGAPDELRISDRFDRPCFVTNFPVEIKGFYFKDELNEDGTERIDPVFTKLQANEPGLIVPGSTGHTVLGSDCLGSEGAGELIGGSQREDDLARLEAKIAHHKLPPEFLEWYVDLRRYGNVPHSGFGIGLERTVAWLAGGSDNPLHLRETIAFPRMLHQYEP
ncbi:asparagine--tRNA ligase [bacterium]|nr:asparagine--tRNA ligase [bacterium]